ncbi:methionyl-tRNA synthetase [Granulicella rosea]|uniref:Methionine--tRNA ligase n=1 Tax=Granulicella rosea TaxID=474952 RepID=A0A239EP21_9BACT|nr:methionine--tRNA ligase [Granulicella rosea]SNS45783.1 methionyl-tRNA synthetase [Granulicella rosea]
MSKPKFYLTTPIYYVNARPHIGHAYTTIVADVIARRHRLVGDDTYFLTGTDEHGQKIERSALAAGVPPQQFTDQVSEQFRSLWQRMGLTYDQYIRTTDEKHKRGAQKLFATLYERGHIYLDSYTGAYCVSDEAFVDLPVGTPCPDCGRLLEQVTEENFFFKLSAFQQPVIDLIESNQLVITPDAARNEVLSFLRGGLKDLSVSRSSFSWGIPVPEPAASASKEKHVIYVWLDALTNYMSAVGYGSDTPEDVAMFERYWPADLHLVGKEITRFHCVYWPAFLMAAGLPTPKQITANGWLLFDNSKMSKSKGNVVRTETILDAFGSLKPDLPKAEQDLFASDVLRYHLLREIPYGQDGSFSFEAMITRYNADLANGYGNLVSRTLAMIQKYLDSTIPDVPERDNSESINLAHADLHQLVQNALITTVSIDGLHEAIEFERLTAYIFRFIGSADGFITKRAPWKMASDGNSTDLESTLYAAAESIRIITALLYPVLPYATATVWAQLGLGDIEAAAKSGELKNLQWGGLKPGTKLGPLSPIFPRADKGLIQIMTDVEYQHAPKSLNETPMGDGPAPDAAPRTASLAEPNPGALVAGSAAVTTEREAVPSTVAENTSPQITIDDFAKIDLRVAQILVAERIPKADKLLRLEVDLGYEKRQILSGIAEYYTPEELVGRRIVVITNLAPRKMRGLESHGMLLAASEGDHGKPALATCGDEIALGSRLK